MLKVTLAFGSTFKGWFSPKTDPLTPVEVPPVVKERVVPVPVEGFGKATALVTFKAAACATGSCPHTKDPERYPVTWVSSRKLVFDAKLQSFDWAMLLQSLLLNRLCTWMACPGCRTMFPVKV